MSRSVHVHSPTYVKTVRDDQGLDWDHWQVFITPVVGTTMLVTLTIRDDWPDQLKDAWQTRKTGMLTGQCPECRQRVTLQYEGQTDGSRLILNHAVDCTGDEHAAMRMLEDWLTAQEADRSDPNGTPGGGG